MHLEIRLVDPKAPATSELGVWDSVAKTWVLEAGGEREVLEVLGKAAVARLAPTWRKTILELRSGVTPPPRPSRRIGPIVPVSAD